MSHALPIKTSLFSEYFFRCSSFTSSGKGNEKQYAASDTSLVVMTSVVAGCRRGFAGSPGKLGCPSLTMSFLVNLHYDITRVSTTWLLCSLNGRVLKSEENGEIRGSGDMHWFQAELRPNSGRSVCTPL